jgi:hypothetical protein
MADERRRYAETELVRRAVHRRAVEAVIWGIPAVNYRRMYEASAAAGEPGDNQLVVWPGLLDWRNQTLTPNPDVIYVMPFVNTGHAGPMVLELPPADDGALNGSIMNLWQTAIEDVGPAGVDEGKGGRCLILPPGFHGDIPPGYLPLRSDTYQCYGLIRSILAGGTDADIERAIAYARRIQLYPLARADDPPDTTWVDAGGRLFDATIPYDVTFFETLDRIVQDEPWLDRDRALIDPLRTIGIEKGKPFEPDPATRAVLADAIEEAHAWLDLKYTQVIKPFTEDARWGLPALPEIITATEAFFAEPDAYPIDSRATCYSFAFFSSKHLGKAQFYLMTITDRDGRPLHGANAYRLSVPPDAPVTQYWSATAYNRETHTLIREMPRAGRSSQSPDLTHNADGSTDLFFSPEPPADNEGNWIPTDPAGEFEVLFRFYGPTSPLYDKSWRLPDIEPAIVEGAAE